MQEEIQKAVAAAYAAGYTEGVAASEGGYVDDVERVTVEWIESEAGQEALQLAKVISPTN